MKYVCSICSIPSLSIETACYILVKCVAQFCSFLLSLPHRIYWPRSAPCSLVYIFFYRRFPFTFSHFTSCFSLELFIHSFSLNFVSLIIFPSVYFFILFLRIVFGNSAKYHSLKNFTDVIIYEEQDDRTKVVGLEMISSAGMPNLHECQRHLHTVYLNRGSGSDVIVVKAVVIQKKSFTMRYPYELHCSSTEDVPETLPDVSKYGFYAWHIQAMKLIGNKSNESFSKDILEQDRKRAEG